MKGGEGFIGNRIRTKNHNRSNHLREKCELSDHADSDSEKVASASIVSKLSQSGDWHIWN